MPKKEIRKSAVKTHRQSERARQKNKACKSMLWTMEKNLRAAISAGDKEKASELLKAQYSALDKAVKYGTLHKNNASRKKARLGAAVAAVGKPAAAAEAAK